MKTLKLKANFKRVSWDDVKNDVLDARPDLYSVIDALPSKNDFPLIKATYPFGCLIVDKGGISKAYCKSDKEENLIDSQLQYSKIPLGLLLDKSSEAFVELDDRIIPLDLLNKGNFLGNFELMNKFAKIEVQPPWSVSAGLRSIFLLQKVSNNVGQKRLKKKLGIKSPLPFISMNSGILLLKFPQQNRNGK